MMRIIEGSVDEIVEYQRKVGTLPPGGGEIGPADVPDGAEPAAARVAVGGLDEDAEEAFFIRQFVYGRAAAAATARRVLMFLERVGPKGVQIEVGVSKQTDDGLTDYVMVRDQGPRRFGAVAYLRPKNGRLTLRLRPEDIADIQDEHIRPRDVIPTQKYAIECPLVDDDAVELALQLTDRALAKVRSTN
jgi:hypothetical protein